MRQRKTTLAAPARNAYHGRRLNSTANEQLYLAVGLPILVVVSSLVISLLQISGIREDIREVRGDIKLVTGRVIEMDNRLTRLEERLSR